MKKILALLCMLASIFTLTACSQVELTDYEQQKVEYAKQLATQMVIPIMQGYMDEAAAATLDIYTAEEVEYIAYNDYQMNVDGDAFKGGANSFLAAANTVGAIVSIGEATAVIDDDQIIVNVMVEGELKNAQAEIILSNDMFMKLNSASLSPVYSVGENMGRAGMNTLIGIGTVFIVLILISFIISCLSLIPKLQERLAKKKTDDTLAVVSDSVPDSAPAPVLVREESYQETDNLELAAVIAAAIAASEGAVSADGFVVRSIRKISRSR